MQCKCGGVMVDRVGDKKTYKHCPGCKRNYVPRLPTMADYAELKALSEKSLQELDETGVVGDWV